MNFKKTFLFLVFLSLVFNTLKAQDFKIESISKNDFEQHTFSADSTAPAVYLIKSRQTYFDYTEKDGWVIINEITERIKILSKEGLDYGTKKIPLYGRDSEKESLVELKGSTYALENGKIKSSKLKLNSNDVFESDKNEYWREASFTMPNVIVGNIVEYTYTTRSPFWKIDDLEMQQEIPVKKYYANIRSPLMFHFRVIKKGDFEINPRNSVKKRNLNFSYGTGEAYGVSRIENQASAIFSELVNEYELEDIPALKNEAYVANIDNYRYSVVYELESTEFNKGDKKNYTTTWEEVARSIFKSKNFGRQLENTRFLKKGATYITSISSGDEEILENALKFIKNKMVWNGKYGKYTEEDIGSAYKNQSGNVAEINLTLIALLRECGLAANPVLVSTQSNGVPLFPTLEGYNYVIAGVRKDNKSYLLDATDKFSAINILPPRVYNWTGLMINPEGITQEIDLNETASAQELYNINAQIDSIGTVTGEMKIRYLGNKALKYRTDELSLSTKEKADLLSENFKLTELRELHTEHEYELGKPINQKFKFKRDHTADVVGGQMYISQLLFLAIQENPFKEETRQFAVDYGNSFSRTKMFVLELPEDYQVTSLPEPVRVNMPDDIGFFQLSVQANNDVLHIMSRFTINKPSIAPQYYQDLKEFYKLYLEKENEKIVLQKT